MTNPRSRDVIPRDETKKNKGKDNEAVNADGYTSTHRLTGRKDSCRRRR